MLMRKVLFTIIFLVKICGGIYAQHYKITGPLGIYHINAGYCYADSLGIDSILIQDEFKLGELDMPDQSFDNGFTFDAEIDSCTQWNANRVLAIIQPLTEHGVYNQPTDTALFAPFPQLDGPGMIQGGARFSQLSELYGGYCGVILDDWNGDTAITRQIRDAVRGKYVDELGNVYSECKPSTPYNKLYCVLYGTGVNTAAMPVIDGISYWYYQGQNCCYTNLDNDIDNLRTNFPDKEIQIGIYLKNTYLNWANPESVHYMLSHAIDRYDNGEINGITLFAGLYLRKDQMPLSNWNAFALPHWLDSLYYPYLGQGTGKVTDCNTGETLSGVSVHVFCKGRLTVDTMMRSSQKTDAAGYYQFGLWAGNRNTDSCFYWAIVEKNGYLPDTVGFWIKRNDTTTLPVVALCAAPQVANTNDIVTGLQVFPNPNNGQFIVKPEEESMLSNTVEVYSLLGSKVYSANVTRCSAYIDLSARPSGVYLVVLRTGNKKKEQKKLVVIQH